MKIIKHFRKYSRVLLLVFMSALLVVFLLGDVIGRAQRSTQQQDFELGEGLGRTMYVSELRRAQNDVQLAQQLGFLRLPIFSTDTQETNVAIFLLMEEARVAGVSVSREQVKQELRAGGVPGAAVEAVRKQTDRSLNSIYDALGRYLAPAMYYRFQSEASGAESAPRVEQAFRDQTQTADVRISVVGAAAMLRHVSEPTEDELLAEFEQGKDREDAHTAEELVFGYRIPDRVQIEYLTVDPLAVESSLLVTGREARSYYQQNSRKYRRPVEGPTLNLDSGPQFVVATYEEVETQVRNDVRREKSIKQAQSLVNRLQQEARQPWQNLAEGEAPEADQVISLAALMQKHADQPGLTYKQTELVDIATLRQEPGLGRAVLEISGQQMPAVTYAFRTDTLTSSDTLTFSDEESELPALKTGEPIPEVAFDTRGFDPVTRQAKPYQAFVFAVVQVAPAGPPASLDDVRAEVVANIKRQKAFEMARVQVEALAEQARAVGLDEAVAKAEELRALLADEKPADGDGPATQPSPVSPLVDRYVQWLEIVTPPQFSRRSGFVRNVGFAPALNEKAFEAQPDTEGHTIIMAPMANQDKWVLAEVVAIHPIYRGDFDAQREQLGLSRSRAGRSEFARLWFDAASIRARTRFTEKTSDEQ